MGRAVGVVFWTAGSTKAGRSKGLWQSLDEAWNNRGLALAKCPRRQLYRGVTTKVKIKGRCSLWHGSRKVKPPGNCSPSLHFSRGYPLTAKNKSKSSSSYTELNDGLMRVFPASQCGTMHIFHNLKLLSNDSIELLSSQRLAMFNVLCDAKNAYRSLELFSVNEPITSEDNEKYANYGRYVIWVSSEKIGPSYEELWKRTH
jgi:hypothetical protein